MAAIPRLSGSQGLQNRLTSRETDGDRRVMAVLLRLELSRSDIAALTVGDLHQNRDDDSLRVHAQTRPPRCPRDEAADRCTDTRVSRLRLARGPVLPRPSKAQPSPLRPFLAVGGFAIEQQTSSAGVGIIGSL